MTSNDYWYQKLMQVLEGGEGRLCLGDFLRLQTYLPLVFFSHHSEHLCLLGLKDIQFLQLLRTLTVLFIYLLWHSTPTTLKTASKKHWFWGHFLLKVSSYSQVFQHFFTHPSHFLIKVISMLQKNARLKWLMKIYCMLIFSTELFTYSLCFTAVGERQCFCKWEIAGNTSFCLQINPSK